MLKEIKYCLWLIVAIICCQNLSAQNSNAEETLSATLPGNEIPVINEQSASDNSLFTVGNIEITGNKKTRAFIILREIPFKTGEEYPLQVLVKKFEDARRQLMNTTLFHEVVVALKKFDGYKVDILVDVKERWYIFPVPYLRPVDRNLNQWIVEQKARLDRVNYGAKVLHNNVTGRNDKLRLYLVGGYTKQISVSYGRPYIDKNLKWGINFGFAVGKNREMNYNTINDKQVFLKDNDHYIRSFLNTSIEATYRKNIKTSHGFGIRYMMEKVSDTIVTLNPSYFKDGRNRVQFPQIYYNMTYYDLDYIPYPTKGYAAQVSASKTGMNNIVNVWQVSAKGSGTWHTGPKTFFNLTAFGSIKVPFKQPYFTLRFLGYGDVFLQGYEYYVIDGVAGGYIKTTLSREMLHFYIKVPGKKGKGIQRIPFRIFGKVFGNSGYVYNPQPGENFLSNTMLYSGGIGIDILTFYDFTLKFEWTFNQLGQNGLFLHRKSVF